MKLRIQRKIRGIILAASVLLLLALGTVRGVPYFWPSPVIELQVPGETNALGNLHVTVIVTAWHSNFLLNQVRFEGAWLDGVQATQDDLMPVVVPYYYPVQEIAKLNRLTWPVRLRHKVIVPLGALAAAGALKPGPITANILAVVRYADPIMPRFNQSVESGSESGTPWNTTVKTARDCTIQLQYEKKPEPTPVENRV